MQPDERQDADERGALVIRAKEEARQVFEAIRGKDLEPAAEWLRAHRPSEEAMAMLAMWLTPEVVARAVKSTAGRHSAKAKRPSTLSQKIRDNDVRSQRELKERLPTEYEAIMAKHGPEKGKQRVNDAISKAWRRVK